jgi:hypothetical protein
MKLHANAKLGPKRTLVICERVIERCWSLTEAAEATRVSERTASKWVSRFRVEGEAGLLERGSEPHSIPHRTPVEHVEAIPALRRLRMTGPEISECLGMALSTVSAVLARIGLGKLSRLEPPEPPNRYERKAGRRPDPHRRQEAGSNRTGRWAPDDRQAHLAGQRPAGSLSTSASTMRPVSPTSRFVDNEGARTALAFLRGAVAPMQPTASPCSG